MLSDDAEANSLPGLEIQANDVRCTHGATTSRIDPEQEFYLQSRGIAKAAADELLIFGFFEEVLGKIEHAPLHDALRDLISENSKIEAGSLTRVKKDLRPGPPSLEKLPLHSAMPDNATAPSPAKSPPRRFPPATSTAVPPARRS